MGAAPGGTESAAGGATLLKMGEQADAVALSPEARALHDARRARFFREVVERGVYFGQPHSEPVEEGATDQVKVGGNGRKFFVSLAGAADHFATPALLSGDGPWIDRTLYLAVPRDAPGVLFPGEWDPLGMRATVSRDMVLTDVFVPDRREPPAARSLRPAAQRLSPTPEEGRPG